MSTIYPDSHFHLLSLKEKEITLSSDYPLSGIDIGTECDDYDLRYPLFSLFKEVHFSLGCGPWSTERELSIDEQLKILEANIVAHRPIALGEIGLDYHWNYSTPENQKNLFIKQLEFANKYNLPVIIHAREADEDIIRILTTYPIKKKGIFHCFSSSAKLAAFAVEQGYFVSFSGNITYKNSKGLQEIAKTIPSSQLLAETDSPYLAPVPMRGRINTPENVQYVYEMLANLRGVDKEELRKAIVSNLNRFYTLSL